MTEVEARFLIERSAQTQQWIEALRACGVEPKQISDIDVVDRYFDTPNWKLLQRGWTYRWRDVSGKRQLAMKSANSANGEDLHGEEVEQSVENFPANGVGVPAGPIAKCLANVRQKKLRELFRINNHRQLFQLRTSERALIEMALDDATVTSAEFDEDAAEDKMQFAELRLKLIEGPEDALSKLAATIQQRFNLLPAQLSPFERSLRPLGWKPPRTLTEEAHQLKSSSFLRTLCKRPMKRNDPTIKLAYRCLLEQFETMLAEEPIAWEGLEIEGVHQMRVATRKIRAGLWAFKTVLRSDVRKEFSQEFKWLARVLGSVRDLDVFQDNLHGYLDGLPAEEADYLVCYRQQLGEQMKTARMQLIECLSSDRYRTLKLKFGEFLQRGPSPETMTIGGGELIRDAAARLLGRQYNRVLRDGRLIMQDSPDEELHGLRIECKRLRYLFEFFRTIYGRSLNPYIKQLKTLQTVLGDFQDANVAMEQLFQHARSVPMQPENRSQLLSLGQLIADQRRKATDQRRQFYKVWRRFDRRRVRKRMLKDLN